MSYIYVNPKYPVVKANTRRKPEASGYVALAIRLVCDGITKARGIVDRAQTSESYADQVIEARRWLESGAETYTGMLAALGYDVPQDVREWMARDAERYPWPVPDAHVTPDGRDRLARAAAAATAAHGSFACSSRVWLELVCGKERRRGGKRRRP